MMGFTPPDFLSKLDVDAIHQDMLAQLPGDIDTGEGGFVWDLTRPTAYIAAEMAQYILPWFLSQIWAQSASGPYLDMHAQRRALSRKGATAAQGFVQVSGQAGTKVPAGSVFSTAGRSGVAPVEFASTQEALLEEGPVQIPVEAVAAGSSGNVPAGAILMVVSDGLAGIQAVANPAPTTGGYGQEDDESLRARILEYDRTPGSYIGNAADYRRWAMAVTGVGGARIIPAQDATGLVTIVLVDSDGCPASDQLCQAVYRYIMEGDNPTRQRLAPLNARLAVRPPEALPVTVSAVLELEAGVPLEEVKAAYLTSLHEYFSLARTEGEIRFTQLAALLSAVPGVHDYRGLALNGTQGNIPLPEDRSPTASLEGMAFTEGVV